MGRLFWKFFFFFWLAQFVTSLGVGLAIWSLRHDGGPPPQGRSFDAEHRPPPGRWVPTGPRGPAAASDAEGRMPPPPPRHDLMRPLLPFLPPLAPLIAGSLVSLIFAALLAWYFSRPIRSLRAALDAVAGGRLETRVAPAMGRRRDELADLGSDFDRMAERLQSLVDSQRHLLHDVSHELRSPLARLQAAVGLMRQQPARIPDFIERVERDTGRMDRLVGELLTLARLDAGMGCAREAAVDLAPLLSEIAEDARFEAAAKACTVDLESGGSLVVAGNGELLHRAIENVVRNALAHSPAGAVVYISARREGGNVAITVSDSGPGVPEAMLGKIFQPFCRGEESGASAGYGLGLAITHSVLACHGGTATAANRPEGGLEVRLCLAARPEAAPA